MSRPDPGLTDPEAAALRGVLDPPRRPGMGELAAALGLSRAALYRRFGSRAALLAALDVHDDPRARLLEAAADLVEAHGADHVTVDDAAARAGVARTTAYRHFPGRGALLQGVLDRYSPARAVATITREAARRPLPEFAAALATAYLDRFVDRPQLLRALLYRATGPGDGDGDGDVRSAVLATLVTPVTDAVATQLRRIGRDDLAPLPVAQALIGPLVLHALTRHLVPAEHLPAPDAAAATIVEVWLHGLRGAAGAR